MATALQAKDPTKRRLGNRTVDESNIVTQGRHFEHLGSSKEEEKQLGSGFRQKKATGHTYQNGALGDPDPACPTWQWASPFLASSRLPYCTVPMLKIRPCWWLTSERFALAEPLSAVTRNATARSGQIQGANAECRRFRFVYRSIHFWSKAILNLCANSELTAARNSALRLKSWRWTNRWEVQTGEFRTSAQEL